MQFGEHRRGETTCVVEVAAFEVLRAGAAVVDVRLRVRQRGDEGTGFDGERVFATIASAVQAPDLPVGGLLRQCLQHGENGGGADPGADQQEGCLRLIEDERAAWCRNVEFVADGESGVQIAADRTIAVRA